MKLDRSSYADQNAVSNDRRDCSVRAYAVAACIPYAEASQLFTDFGRKKNHGTFQYITAKVIKSQFPDASYFDSKYTLKQFIATHTQGHYVVFVSGHCLAVCDGVLFDWFEKPRRIVKSYWKLV